MAFEHADYGEKLSEAEQADRERKIKESQARRRLENAGADVGVKCPRKLKKAFEPLIRDFPQLSYHEEAEEMCVSGWSDSLETRLYSTLDHAKIPEAKAFRAALPGVKKAIQEHVQRNAEKAKTAIDDELANQSLVKSEAELLLKGQSARKRDRTILQQAKAGPKPEFVEAEPKTWKGLAEEAAGRLLQLHTGESVELKNEEKQHNKAIKELQEKADPLHLEISQLKAERDTDGITEAQDRDLSNAIGYLERKVDKLDVAIHSHYALRAEIENKLSDHLDNKIGALETVGDHHDLLRQVKNHHQRTRRKVRQNEKVLRERDDLEQLQKSLNDRWKRLTGDEEDLVQPLALRANAKQFFI